MPVISEVLSIAHTQACKAYLGKDFWTTGQLGGVLV